MFDFLEAAASIIGTIVLGFCLLAIGAELAIRLWRWLQVTLFVEEVQRKDFLSPEYGPYLNWIEDWSKPMFQYLPIGLRHFNLDNPIGPVRNNALGFRCDELTGSEPGELRVAVLGGSAAWGCGASSNEATISGQLERLINHDGRLLSGFDRAKVYNLAQVDGHQTQDLLTALFYLPRLRPHIAVSFTGWNELVCNGSMRRDLLERYGVFYLTEMAGWQPLKAGGVSRQVLAQSFWIWSSKWSALAAELGVKHYAPAPAQQRPVAECIEVGLPLFADHLVRLDELAATYGFRHFQFLQPNIYRKRTLTAEEAKIIELYDEVRPIQGGKATGDFLRTTNVYQPLLDRVRHDPRIQSVTDLSDMFLDEAERRYFSLVHMTDTGYQVVAERIYDTLVAAAADGRSETSARSAVGDA